MWLCLSCGFINKETTPSTIVKPGLTRSPTPTRNASDHSRLAIISKTDEAIEKLQQRREQQQQQPAIQTTGLVARCVLRFSTLERPLKRSES